MYEWAVATVRARSVRLPGLPGGVALAPGVDFAAHSPGGGGGPQLAYEGIFREPRVRLAAERDLRAGAGVGYDYGLTGSALLCR